MSRRALGFLIFALVVSAGCVRLGCWQLHRLAERRAVNAMLSTRLSAPPLAVRDVLRDSATAGFRRASATGTYDFASELALASRTRQGSPGVNIVTPLRLAGTDTAVLVNRGWVYAPDAMTADLTRWSEPTAATVSGYLQEIGRAARGKLTAETNPRVIRHLDIDSLAKRFPYPIAPFMLVVTEAPSTGNGSGKRDSTPARIPLPLLDEGPHLGYAFQWFAFALIGVVGAGFGIRADARGTLRRGVHRAQGRAG